MGTFKGPTENPDIYTKSKLIFKTTNLTPFISTSIDLLAQVVGVTPGKMANACTHHSQSLPSKSH